MLISPLPYKQPTNLTYLWWKEARGSSLPKLIPSGDSENFINLGEILFIKDTSNIYTPVSCVVFFCEDSSEFSLSGCYKHIRDPANSQSAAHRSAGQVIRKIVQNPRDLHEGDENVTFLCHPASNAQSIQWMVKKGRTDWTVLNNDDKLNSPWAAKLRKRIVFESLGAALTLKRQTWNNTEGTQKLAFQCCSVNGECPQHALFNGMTSKD